MGPSQLYIKSSSQSACSSSGEEARPGQGKRRGWIVVEARLLFLPYLTDAFNHPLLWVGGRNLIKEEFAAGFLEPGFPCSTHNNKSEHIPVPYITQVVIIYEIGCTVELVWHVAIQS